MQAKQEEQIIQLFEYVDNISTSLKEINSSLKEICATNDKLYKNLSPVNSVNTCHLATKRPAEDLEKKKNEQNFSNKFFYPSKTASWENPQDSPDDDFNIYSSGEFNSNELNSKKLLNNRCYGCSVTPNATKYSSCPHSSFGSHHYKYDSLINTPFDDVDLHSPVDDSPVDLHSPVDESPIDLHSPKCSPILQKRKFVTEYRSAEGFGHPSVNKSLEKANKFDLENPQISMEDFKQKTFDKEISKFDFENPQINNRLAFLNKLYTPISQHGMFVKLDDPKSIESIKTRPKLPYLTDINNLNNKIKIYPFCSEWKENAIKSTSGYLPEIKPKLPYLKDIDNLNKNQESAKEKVENSTDKVFELLKKADPEWINFTFSKCRFDNDITNDQLFNFKNKCEIIFKPTNPIESKLAFLQFVYDNLFDLHKKIVVQVLEHCLKNSIKNNYVERLYKAYIDYLISDGEPSNKQFESFMTAAKLFTSFGLSLLGEFSHTMADVIKKKQSSDSSDYSNIIKFIFALLTDFEWRVKENNYELTIVSSYSLHVEKELPIVIMQNKFLQKEIDLVLFVIN